MASIPDPHAFRQVGRGHILAWHRDLEQRGLAGATIRRKLSALLSRFDALREANAVTGNPVDGIKRPKEDSQEGTTPAISGHQARTLLAIPKHSFVKGLRDRAMPANLLSHGLRRAELPALRLVVVQERRGVRHLRVLDKGIKIRFVPLNPTAAGAIANYLKEAGHGDDRTAPLFYSASNNARRQGITEDGAYRILARYSRAMGIDVDGFGQHALRATAIANTPEQGADLEKVPDWVGHANTATTHTYDRRKHSAEG